MSGSHRAKLVLEDDDVESIFRCVSPEVEELEGRSSVDVAFSEGRLVFDVSAPNLVALRAGVNTWSRFVEIAETVLNDR